MFHSKLCSIACRTLVRLKLPRYNNLEFRIAEEALNNIKGNIGSSINILGISTKLGFHLNSYLLVSLSSLIGRNESQL